jgi:hypothetical protein
LEQRLQRLQRLRDGLPMILDALDDFSRRHARLSFP